MGGEGGVRGGGLHLVLREELGAHCGDSGFRAWGLMFVV